MPNCANCGQPLEGSNACRFCGAYQVSPDATQPQQPISPYSQGAGYPGQGYPGPGYPQYQQPGQPPYQGQGAYPAPPYPGQPSQPPARSRAMLPVIVGLIALVLVVAAGIGAFALLSGKDEDGPVVASSTSQSASQSQEADPQDTSSESPEASQTPQPTAPTPTRTATRTPKPQVTVTVTKPPKPPKPTVTVTRDAEPDQVQPDQESTAIDCGNDIWADGTASCAFAGNVAQAYWDSGGASTLYDVYSPVTGQYYDLDCWGSDPVTCQVGRAIIFFY